MMTRILMNFFTVVVLLTVTATAVFAEDSQYKGFPRGSALISVQELKQLLDAKDPKLVILAAENNVEYRLGHIPGSYQVDRPAIEAPPETQNGVSGNIIDADSFTKLARNLGINRDSIIIVYDSKYDATRLWWAFTYYGKGNVRVLDGGVKAWRDAGNPVDLLAPEAAKPGNFTALISRASLRVDTPDILKLKNNSKAQLWDNRDRKEFCGEELKKGAARAGRIPWGNHSDWAQFKKKDNQAEWLTAAEIKSVLEKQGYDVDKEQYFFCQSGVRSTQAIFALYLSGWPLEKLHNYDSSWIGWSRDQSLPIETGCQSGIAQISTGDRTKN
ncbi:MAG: sulfurtransferase [Desulfuromonadaceae bacterium]